MTQFIKIYGDKIRHFCVSAAVIFCGAWLFGPIVAILIALAWSFGKEKYDEMHGGKWDDWDIIAILLSRRG